MEHGLLLSRQRGWMLQKTDEVVIPEKGRACLRLIPYTAKQVRFGDQIGRSTSKNGFMSDLSDLDHHAGFSHAPLHERVSSW